MIHLDYDNFNKYIFDLENPPTHRKYSDETPCIIDFYTPWCTPCKDVDKWLQLIADEHKGKIKIFKIDCDKEKNIAQKLNITSYPHLLLLKNNQQPKSIIGLYPFQYLQNIIQTELL
jgi:thioredoxin